GGRGVPAPLRDRPGRLGRRAARGAEPAALRRPAGRHPPHLAVELGRRGGAGRRRRRRGGRAVRRADARAARRAARGARRAGGAGQPARLPHLRLGRPGRDGGGVHGDGQRPRGPAPALRRPAARRPLRRRRLGAGRRRVRPRLRDRGRPRGAGRAMAGNLTGERAATWVRRGLAVLAPPAVAVAAVEAAAAIGKAWAAPPAAPVAGPEGRGGGPPQDRRFGAEGGRVWPGTHPIGDHRAGADVQGEAGRAPTTERGGGAEVPREAGAAWSGRGTTVLNEATGKRLLRIHA